MFHEVTKAARVIMDASSTICVQCISTEYPASLNADPHGPVWLQLQLSS